MGAYHINVLSETQAYVREGTRRWGLLLPIPFPGPEAVIHAPNLKRTQIFIFFFKALQSRRNQGRRPGQTTSQASAVECACC